MSEEKKEKKIRKVLQILKNKYFIVSFLFLTIVLFIDKNNLILWAKDYVEVFRQEKIIRKYRKDIKLLDEKLLELSSNKDSVEKFARENYYFLEKDEDIFIVEEE